LDNAVSSRAVPADSADLALVAALTAGNEQAYVTLIRRYTPLMLRVAQTHVAQRAVAEDVVQDTWLCVLRSIAGFEGRSTFKTWLMRILVNTARSRASRDSRTVCWSTTSSDDALWDDALADHQFGLANDPEGRTIASQTRELIMDALGTLPERQRMVVVLRDLEGRSSEEVCLALRISAGNQRLLLHRGRTRLRELIAPLLLESGAKAGQPRAPGVRHRPGSIRRACGRAPGYAS
jgi:RNA polymerase sigma-70 factor (ECF subfamily)